MGEKEAILENIADTSPVNRKTLSGSGIKKYLPVESDPSSSGIEDACDCTEDAGLPCSGMTEKHSDAACFANIHIDNKQIAPFRAKLHLNARFKHNQDLFPGRDNRLVRYTTVIDINVRIRASHLAIASSPETTAS